MYFIKKKLYTLLLIDLITKNPLIKILLEMLKPFLNDYAYYYICSFIVKTNIYFILRFNCKKKGWKYNIWKLTYLNFFYAYYPNYNYTNSNNSRKQRQCWANKGNKISFTALTQVNIYPRQSHFQKTRHPVIYLTLMVS